MLRNRNYKTDVIAAALAIAGMLLPLASPWLAQHDGVIAWLVDLAVHWQWPLLFVLLLYATLASVRQRRYLLLFAAAPLPWLSASPPAPTSDADGATLTVASANVLYTNQEAAPLIAWLAQEQPDVVVLLEASRVYMRAVAELADYPYKAIQVDEDPFGIAVISRYPLVRALAIEDEDRIPYMRTHIEWNGERIGLIALHPMPPVSQHFHARRNHALREVALAAAQSGQPRIFAGDLNATPWSSAFQAFSQHGLKRAGGLLPTWPAAGLGVFGIPIDQIVVTSHWAVVSHQRGPDIGSDHLPVLTKLQRRAATAVAQ